MPVFPGDLHPKVKSVSSIEDQGYQENELTMSTHTGTHIDAPFHIIPGGYTLDAFPPEKFFGEGLILDCRQLEKITADSIKQSLSSRNPDFVLLYTGWNTYWGTDAYFSKIPVLELNAAKYLADLSLKGVGVDTPSFDPVGSDSLGNHKTLLSKNIVLIENLTGLGYLLEKKFIFSCFPLKIKSADGSPVRAIAIIEE